MRTKDSPVQAARRRIAALEQELSVPEPKPAQSEPHDIENDVDSAIEVCGGDLRATVRALVAANTFLHAQNERLLALVSPGFMRGKLSLLDLP